MTDSERQQILKMIDDGKISAEQGLALMQALLEEPEDELVNVQETAAEQAVEVLQETDQSSQTGSNAARSNQDFERKLAGFRRLWVVPLVIGVVTTVLGALWMFSAMQAGGLSFWFFLAWLPFLAGVLITAVAFSSRTSRWIYINVKQKSGETPQRIVITFPLSLVSWVMGFVKFTVPDPEVGAINEVMNAVFQSTKTSEPLLVDVQEEDGEHVQVFIG